jgi:Ca-activated chloride channel family protein
VTFELLDPHWLWLSLLAPILFALRLWRGTAAIRFAPTPLLDTAVAATRRHSWRARARFAAPTLAVLGLAAAAIALARPVHREPLPPSAAGIDIVLCIDVSSSMAETDMADRASRLDVAKVAADRFVEGRPNDRIGLATFARYPDVRCPPTLDHEALRTILAGVTLVERDGPEDATGIGAAVARVVQRLRGTSEAAKVVVVLTDGEENVATAQTPDEIAPLHAAQLARQDGVKVHAIAAGSGTRTASGTTLPIDTTQLQRLAEATGGTFFRAPDAAAIASVYATIDATEKVVFDAHRERLHDRFAPWLACAFVLLLASRVLAKTTVAVAP